MRFALQNDTSCVLTHLNILFPLVKRRQSLELFPVRLQIYNCNNFVTNPGIGNSNPNDACHRCRHCCETGHAYCLLQLNWTFLGRFSEYFDLRSTGNWSGGPTISKPPSLDTLLWVFDGPAGSSHRRRGRPLRETRTPLSSGSSHYRGCSTLVGAHPVTRRRWYPRRHLVRAMCSSECVVVWFSYGKQTGETEDRPGGVSRYGRGLRALLVYNLGDA